MQRKHRFTAVRLMTGVVTLAAMGLLASPAFAISTGETVTGTALSSLSLTAGTGALFTTNFAPGNTATALGALAATDTNPSWTLQVEDTGSGAGKMVAATGPTCTGSDPTMADPLQVSVTSALGGVTSAGTVSISNTNQAVASATDQLLAANVLTTNYSQTIPSSESMLSGCVYTLTATYTLQ